MRDRHIPRTNVRLTELGFGGASLGNLYTETSEEDAAAAVAAAWSRGIRYFDTAPHYGLGLSERRLGELLAHYPRDEFVLSTKVGRLIVDNDSPTERDTEGYAVSGARRREWSFSRDGIVRSVDESLSRLGMDRIDVLFVHDPDVSEVPGAAVLAAETLIELRDQGVVGAVGIGSNSAAEVAALFRSTDIDTAMLAGRYTLLEQRAADEVFEAAGDRGIIAVGAFNSGVLSRPRPPVDAKYNYLAAPAAVIARANALANVAESVGATLPQAALAFPLQHAQVVSVAIGMRTAAQVHSNVELFEDGAPDELWLALRSAGLLG